MTNLEWFKQKWIQFIHELSEEELYEMLTNGTVNIGICKFCEKIFPTCEDSLKDDSICRERFQIMCSMEHQKMEESEHV